MQQLEFFEMTKNSKFKLMTCAFVSFENVLFINDCDSNDKITTTTISRYYTPSIYIL